MQAASSAGHDQVAKDRRSTRRARGPGRARARRSRRGQCAARLAPRGSVDRAVRAGRSRGRRNRSAPCPPRRAPSRPAQAAAIARVSPSATAHEQPAGEAVGRGGEDVGQADQLEQGRDLQRGSMLLGGGRSPGCEWGVGHRRPLGKDRAVSRNLWSTLGRRRAGSRTLGGTWAGSRALAMWRDCPMHPWGPPASTPRPYRLPVQRWRECWTLGRRSRLASLGGGFVRGLLGLLRLHLFPDLADRPR